MWDLLLNICVCLVCLRCRGEVLYDTPNEKYEHVCDYVIVGAGTTSLALAARLAQIPWWKVCVMERGPMDENMKGWYTNNYQYTSPHDPFWLTQPVLETLVTNSDGYTYNANNDGRLIYIPRYRGRGGTSRVYGAIARRASPAVLDMWPEGWKHDDLTRYYKRVEDHYCYYDSENVTGISEAECKQWHGEGGHMQLNSQIQEAFQNFPRQMKYICEDKNMPWHGYAADYNGPTESRQSCSVFQQYKLRTDKDYYPTKEARVNRASQTARGSSYTGYYQYNKNRPYLYHSSPVTKILFEGKKAVGVRYLYVPTGKTHNIRARKEVIVGAGSFDTPHLLQVSGVGPKEVLKNINANVTAENEHVGQHLWDHISVPYVLQFTKHSDDLCCKEGDDDVPTVNIDGTVYNTSELESINGPFSWILHMRSNVTREPADMSDIQLYVMGNSKLFDETGPLCTDDHPEYNHAQDVYEDLTHDNEGTIRIIDQWPEYRGFVNAVTLNIFDKPTLQYGWNYTIDGVPTHQFKQVSQLVRDQVRLLRNMFFGPNVHKPLKDLIVREVTPGKHIKSDDDLNEWMRGMLVSALHPVGTCKMPECADEFLRVRGVENLRVADASAFATQIDGNPAATLYAMAEKLADMLQFQNLKYIGVAVRKDLSYSVGEHETSDSAYESATDMILSDTKCIDASVSVERSSTGKDTSALIVKWSLLCSEDSNERHIADNVAMVTLGLVVTDGCSLRDYPLFNREEATLPEREPTPKHASSTYVFAVWCQFFKDVESDELWSSVGNWNGDGGKVPGSKDCFKLNCDPEQCSIMKYADDSNREFIYKENNMTLPVTDYISTKKVVSRNNGKSSSFMRTGSMISNPGVDWYEDVAEYVLEHIYAASGQRYSHNYPPLNTQAGWWSNDSDGLLIYETKGIYSGTQVAAFDLDNTIIKTKSGKPFAVDENDWVFTSPQVKPKLQANHKNGINNVIMSNQNGIGNGKQNKTQWMAKIEQVTAALGVPMYVIAATEDNDYRKPETGMWDYYSCTLNQFSLIDKSKAMYCGDAAGRPNDIGDSDKMFAQNVGISFYTPEQEFNVTECNLV